MKIKHILLLTILITGFCGVGANSKYVPFDKSDPVVFKGDYIIYDGQKIKLGPSAYFIDGQFSDEEAAAYDFVFNSVKEALENISDGTEEKPMVLYIAPWVYWIDDPDDPEVRIPKPGEGSPYGMEIDCEWLRFQGLSKKAENVVLACNRGQTMGAKGNFTMFKITGNGARAENITFGNYCNVDLEYPLKPELGREKRGSAIVQAQLVYIVGDKVFARNTRFISRLNLLPYYATGRAFYDHCHFESTDDALSPTGVYLDCTFDYYSSKPFGHTSGTGAVLLNCDINSLTRGEQYLVKGRGPIAAIDCRMKGKLATYWGWKSEPALEGRNYNFNNQFNGKTVVVGSKHPYATVDMAGKNILNAYRFEYKGQVIYNTYNLLRGNDDWDPMGIKQLVLDAEKEKGTTLSEISTQLIISPTRQNIETGKEPVVLTVKINRFSNVEKKGVPVNWFVDPEYKNLVNLKDNGDGTCTVIPANENDETKQVIIKASTGDGLEAASVLYVAPRFLDAPAFISTPIITKNGDGFLSADYKLDMKYADQSLITWYRCSDASGKNPVEVAVSRYNEPKKSYKLSKGDVGYFIKVSVEPKHLRCEPGEPVSYILPEAITENDVDEVDGIYEVDLKTLSTKIQQKIIPGFWTVDCFKPEDTNEWNDWAADNSQDSWFYGVGVNGAASDTGLIQAHKGGRLRYTPVGDDFGDMKISFTACPAKTAGQGFSSAKAQYMDIFIKYDTKNKNGYAFRLYRTTKYHNAIDCVFMKYENGKGTPVVEAVSTSCYRTPCFITVGTKGNKIYAHMESSAEYYVEPGRPEVKLNVDMETEINPNKYGGMGFQHTGTVHSGATLIKDLEIEWE